MAAHTMVTAMTDYAKAVSPSVARSETISIEQAGRPAGRLHGPGMRISTRLLLIIAACLLPTILLQLAVSWSQWNDRKAALGDLAVQQARLLAGNVDSIAEGARILLGAAAEFRQIRTQGENCGNRMAALRHAAPGFAFIALMDTEGRASCASDPALLGTAADMGWAREGLAARSFTAGRFVRPEYAPGGILPFYLPVAAGPAEPGGVLVAALDLTWLEQHLVRLKGAGSPFIANGVLTVTDTAGTILGRDVRHAEFLGQRLPPAAQPMLRASSPGLLRLHSIDGTDRVVGYSPPSPASHGLAVAVGFHEPELMQDIETTLLQSALLLGSVTLIVFLVTAVAARRLIAAPTEALLAVARRWREGDLSARAPAWGEGSEFGQLAAAYNGMAEALQRREAELREHAQALEARVASRTKELLQANEQLRIEAAERRQTEADLLQAQKLQAVGQLAGGIAHDFNNILQAVAGGVSLIRRRIRDAEAVERLSGMIEDAARRGESITRRLLTFARREELRAERLDMAELLPSLREVLATLGAAIRVQVEVQPGLPPVSADRGKLETVLVNLATNARDAMPDGGSLTLAATAVEVTGAGDRPGLAAGQYVCLTVADTGTGMDEATLARASDPFFTTKPIGQGTGLGLSMARGFAEASGGMLEIESRLGQGTRVSLWLPVADCAPVEEGRPPADVEPCVSRSAGPQSMPRVLLVDDEPVVREVLAAQLADAGFTVTVAGDGRAALALLEGDEVRYEVLVTDLAMPEMDGLALIREARQRWPNLPAILLTGYAGDAVGRLLSSTVEGRLALLRKPITGAELADQVTIHLAERQNQPEPAR